jgi:hypothetical protein
VVSIIETPDSRLDEIQEPVIRSAKPSGNREIGIVSPEFGFPKTASS